VVAPPGVDPQGQLLQRPRSVGYALAVMVVLIMVEALGEVVPLSGPGSLYQVWLHDGVVLAAAALMLLRSAYEPTGRAAWLLMGVATALWGAGSVAWSLAYDGTATPPFPSFADVTWLLWYPLVAAGIALLIRTHVRRFELHRWLDGVAVMLLVLAAGFAIVIEPVSHEADLGTFATVVDFSYPVLDLLLIGAILGVYGLLGWRPDRMWLLLGLGVVASASVDAVFAVQAAHRLVDDHPYDFVWTLAAFLLAAAAWATPSGDDEHLEVTGVRAIALVLVAQAVAAGIQVYALFGELGRSERIVTLLVLILTSVQIVLARPRPSGDTRPDAQREADPPAPRPAG